MDKAVTLGSMLLILLQLPASESYSMGAPDAACNAMTPGHQQQAQKGETKYLEKKSEQHPMIMVFGSNLLQSDVGDAVGLDMNDGGDGDCGDNDIVEQSLVPANLTTSGSWVQPGEMLGVELAAGEEGRSASFFLHI